MKKKRMDLVMHGSCDAENRDGGRSTSYSLMMSISHDSIRRQRKKRNRSTVMQCRATPLQKKLTNMGVGHVSAQVVSHPPLTGRKAASRGRVCPHS